MNRRIVLLTLAVLVMLGSLTSACSREENELVGVWEYEGESMTITYLFFEDGAFRFDAMGRTIEGTWEIQDNQLCITFEDESGQCIDYEILDNTLLIDEMLLTRK